MTARAEDTELLTAAREWAGIYAEANADPSEDQVVVEGWNQQLFAIETKVAAMPPETVSGLAAKILVLTNFGGFTLGQWEEGIIADATRLSPIQRTAGGKKLTK